MGVTGHKTRSVFDGYEIVNEDDLRSALGKLGASMSPDPQNTESNQTGVQRFRKQSGF